MYNRPQALTPILEKNSDPMPWIGAVAIVITFVITGARAGLKHIAAMQRDKQHVTSEAPESDVGKAIATINPSSSRIRSVLE